MKNLIYVITICLLLSSCALSPKQERPYPYVGMTEEQLYAMWGWGGDTSTYDSQYGSHKITWYTRDVFGFVYSGCKVRTRRNPLFLPCVAVHIEGGKVVSISTH